MICPTSLVLNWKAEVEKWLPPSQMRMTTVVTSDTKKEDAIIRLKTFASAPKGSLLILS